MKYTFLSTLCLCASFWVNMLFAQPAGQVRIIPRATQITASDIQQDWNPQLMTVKEAPSHGGSVPELMRIKDSLTRRFAKPVTAQPIQKTQSSAIPPTQLRNLQGNLFSNSVPSDNDIAISNAGKVISVANTNIFFYDAATNSGLGAVSLDAFSPNLGNNGKKFDPKVMYDPQADRFVVLFLNGFDSQNSLIIVGFSATNDPKGAWNLYTLPGSPYGDTLWTDYPMLTMSNQELFITVNLLRDNSSWQTGFAETIIWQVKKQSGYDGAPLQAAFLNNAVFNGKPIRNLCPARGGTGLRTAPTYFLSNRNFAAKNDTFFIATVADTLGGLSDTISVRALISDVDYRVPPNGRQEGIHRFATNDARVLGAFIENDEIQFVQNCMDTTTGFAALLHGVIAQPATATQVTSHILGDSIRDFGYPNISYAGYTPSQRTAIISFNHCAPTVASGNSAILYDGSNYSDAISLKKGESYVNLLNDAVERWGDYSGSQRKYNEQGTVWISLSYGRTNHQHATWISEVQASAAAPIAPAAQTEISGAAYPNPMADMLQVTFELPQREWVAAELYALDGTLVRRLMYEYVKAGSNAFSFSTQPLPAGVYFLRISAPTRNAVLFSEKIVKQ